MKHGRYFKSLYIRNITVIFSVPDTTSSDKKGSQQAAKKPPATQKSKKSSTDGKPKEKRRDLQGTLDHVTEKFTYHGCNYFTFIDFKLLVANIGLTFFLSGAAKCRIRGRCLPLVDKILCRCEFINPFATYLLLMLSIFRHNFSKHILLLLLIQRNNNHGWLGIFFCEFQMP